MNTDSRTPSSSASNTRRGMFIGGGLLAAAVIVALIISFASDGGSGSSSSEAARIPSGSVRQVSFAETGGEPLPRYDPTVQIDPAVGTSAPTITASYFDGTETFVDPSDGQPRVVLFVAHWCPHCQNEVDSLSDWFAENGAPSDVEVLTISTSVDEGAPNYPPSEWFLREQWPVPVLRDSIQNDLAIGYGLSGFPYVVVIDADGNIVSRSSGSMSISQWEALLDAAVAG
jgi:thiol-disulfide isomerase/thioredoxin